MSTAHQLSPNEATRLSKLYQLSGIEYRYSVLSDFGAALGDYQFFGNQANLSPFPTTYQRSLVYEKQAPNLGHAAVLDMLNQLPNLDITKITHLISVSCTGMYAPGLDIDIVQLLGLNTDIERTCINFMGCYGAFNALKTADYICRADDQAKVLIIDVELCTLHFQRESNLENWVSNALFADGAAAVLVEPQKNKSGQKGFLLKAFYNQLFVEAKQNMAWRIGDTGFQMHLSSKIAKNISAKIHQVTGKLLEKAKLETKQISGFAVHPGGRRILEVCEEAFDYTLALKHSYDVLKEYGNMSSCTILFVLKRFLENNNEANDKNNQHIMSYAFGPGLTFETMLLEKI